MALFLLMGSILMSSLNVAPSQPFLQIWHSGVPNGWRRNDVEGSERDVKQNFLIVKNVSKPTLQLFVAKHPIPDAPTVIVCPGGGYSIEAIEHEGWEIAERLNQSGINSAVLKYRLPNRESDHPLAIAPLQDAQRSIRVLRSHAKEYGLDPKKIGILGFSAGGNLAALASNAPEAAYSPVDPTDTFSPLPNFTVLIYPAYLAKDGTTEMTAELHVTKETPPAFIVQTMDDPIHAENAIAYALACKAVRVPAELHLWAKGGHGYGLRTKEAGLRTWPDLLVDWLSRL
jgi:acetyl esterase/lipase